MTDARELADKVAATDLFPGQQLTEDDFSAR